MSVNTQVERIDHRKAATWLKSNRSNRKLRKSIVARYAADMASSRWVLNGESIVFDAKGLLIDGQHRLAACIEAGAPFESVVVRGVPQGVAFQTIDGGFGRTVADALGGVEYGAITAAVAKLALLHERGQLLKVKQGTVTRQEIVEFAKANYAAIKSASAFVVGNDNYKKLASPTLLAVSLYLFRKYDTGKADSFFASVMDGVDLKANDPAYLLRERLIAAKNSGTRHTLPLLALIFKAFRLYLAGTKTTSLRIPKVFNFDLQAAA
jgi:hypothetical protein